MNDKITPLVSVCMITYNHAAYIKTALDGILKQKISFPIELIIGEDCSTDDTRSICQEYQSKYPQVVRLLLPEKNMGIIPNFRQTLQAAKGKYIAYCEGDDYWTDPLKLQKQVDFMEVNPDFSICCHRAQVLNELRKTLKTPKAFHQLEYTQADVANHNFIQTLTILFRRNCMNDFSETSIGSISGDYFLNMMISGKGKIKYIPDVMAVYRQHGDGSWHSLGAIRGNENTLKILNYYLNTDVSEVVKENLKRNIVRHHIKMYDLFKRNGKETESKSILEKVLCSDFAEAWNKELELIILGAEKKERKIGRFVLIPYIAFRTFLSKFSFIIHRLKYD